MELLSDRDQIYIILLHKLRKRHHTVNEIIEECGISRNKFNKIVSYLNDIFKHDAIVNNQSIVKMTYKHHVSFDYYISKVLQNSLEYSLLEYIFFNETTTYLKLSNELYISESTLRKVISQMNTKLKKIKCEILTRPIRIVGDEKNIRFLFFQLFKEKYGLESIPFSEIEKKYVDHLYEMKYSFIGQSNTYQEKNEFRLRSLISLNRERHNHPLRLINQINVSAPKLNKIINHVEKLNLPLLKTLPKSISINLIIQIFMDCLSEDCWKHSDNDQVQIKKNKEMNSIKMFIDELELLFNIRIQQEEKIKIYNDLYDRIYGYLYVDKKVTKIITVNHDYENFLKETKLLLKDINPKIKVLFKKNIEIERQHYFPYVLYFLNTRLNKLFSRQILDKLTVKVYLYIDSDYYYANYLKTRIQFEIGEDFSIIIIKDLHQLKLINHDKDLLITNVLNDLINKYPNIIRISHCLSYHDLYNITDYLKQLKRSQLNSLVLKKE